MNIKNRGTQISHLSTSLAESVSFYSQRPRRTLVVLTLLLLTTSFLAGCTALKQGLYSELVEVIPSIKSGMLDENEVSTRKEEALQILESWRSRSELVKDVMSGETTFASEVEEYMDGNIERGSKRFEDLIVSVPNCGFIGSSRQMVMFVGVILFLILAITSFVSSLRKSRPDQFDSIGITSKEIRNFAIYGCLVVALLFAFWFWILKSSSYQLAANLDQIIVLVSK